MKRIGLVLAITLATPAIAQGHPAGAAPYGAGTAIGDEDLTPPGRWALRGGDTVFGDDAGLNAFFYPNGYDPQYGAEGRLADAADFAADYGCRPIWNAKYGRYMPACN